MSLPWDPLGWHCRPQRWGVRAGGPTHLAGGLDRSVGLLSQGL